MPKYSFQCNQCDHKFTVKIPWQEKENVLCPCCGNKDIKQDYSLVGLTSRSGSNENMGEICPSSGAP